MSAMKFHGVPLGERECTTQSTCVPGLFRPPMASPLPVHPWDHGMSRGSWTRGYIILTAVRKRRDGAFPAKSPARVYCVHRPWDGMIGCTRKTEHTLIAAANPSLPA